MTTTPVHPYQSKPWLIRLVMARPRLLICLVIGVLTAFLLPDSLAQRTMTRVIIGWNVGAGLYLVLAGRLMFWSTHERMRTRALQQDEGRIAVLVLVIAAAIMCRSNGRLIRGKFVFRFYLGVMYHPFPALSIRNF